MSQNNEETCLSAQNGKTEGDENEEQENQYVPIISLPEILIPTLEEDEIVMVNMRAKIYRYDAAENPPEWKERGTGNVKMLHHKIKDTVRVVMRRDKTLKLCANHFITPQMELKPSASCERAWVYSVKADYIDETAKSQLLAIKFANIENAQKWKDAFDEAKKIVSNCGSPNNDTLEDEAKKIITEDALKLNDTFDDEKKNSSIVKDENGEHKVEDQPSKEVSEKLTNLTINEAKEAVNS